MSRNSEFRFGVQPQVNISRSVFKMRKNVKGTFNLGKVIPFYVNSDILPGDTFKIKQSIVVRMLTPIYPTMDNLVLDTYFFAVPYRLVWDNFKKFMGENENGAWTQTTEYEIPQLTTTTHSANEAKGTLIDYFGLPTGIAGLSFSALPFRAYGLVINEFFRNQNLIAPYQVPKNDTTVTLSFSDFLRGGTPFTASRLPDYLSTSLPQPQKGMPISIPLGTEAKIYGNGKNLTLSKDLNGMSGGLEYTNNGLKIGLSDSEKNQPTGQQLDSMANPSGYFTVGLPTKASGIESNAYADLSSATAATINALRLAFQTQKILETDARYGTRYVEIIKGHFGVISPDARQQRPEYLGGKRIPIQMNQVAQTSSTDSTSPQGNVAAFSLTADVDQVFTKSFTEHTIILGVMVIRYLSHTYQQKIPRMWSRRKRLDFYFPTLAHLGEQPVLNKEIYAQGSAVVDASGNPYDEQVFGYQERWAEYKYEENIICGEMRSVITTPLDSWHYGDKYTSLPVLGQNWISEDDTYLKRTLAVQNKDQFLFDTDLTITAIRPIPTYCYPGLIDHF